MSCWPNHRACYEHYGNKPLFAVIPDAGHSSTLGTTSIIASCATPMAT
ncbi:MAG TPA: hypothetical protein G4N99_08595 [Thermoflexia bacterium]|nr:hypothetical protein [Thermoflexia bacterium]